MSSEDTGWERYRCGAECCGDPSIRIPAMSHLYRLTRVMAKFPCVAIVLAGLFAGIGAGAQPLLDTTGRWERIDPQFPAFHSGLSRDNENASSLFFRNDGVGYLTAAKRY